MSKFMKWLTKCGFFKAKRLIFIIKVHTKNICNQLINLVETMYPKNNIPKINLMSIFLNNISLLFLGQLKFVSSPLITGNTNGITNYCLFTLRDIGELPTTTGKRFLTTRTKQKSNGPHAIRTNKPIESFHCRTEYVSSLGNEKQDSCHTKPWSEQAEQM